MIYKNIYFASPNNNIIEYFEYVPGPNDGNTYLLRFKEIFEEKPDLTLSIHDRYMMDFHKPRYDTLCISDNDLIKDHIEKYNGLYIYNFIVAEEFIKKYIHNNSLAIVTFIYKSGKDLPIYASTNKETIKHLLDTCNVNNMVA